MDPNIDLAKFVGAASAPVALVIASCIYLGNLTTKYNSLFERTRTLSEELREKAEQEEAQEPGGRAESLQEQLRLYEQRINGTMKSTFSLNLAIICFVLTVALTAVNMLFPKNVPLVMSTALVMFAGLGLICAGVVIELWSNRLAKPVLDSELSTGTPAYEPLEAKRA